jgi:hypothetical protein
MAENGNGHSNGGGVSVARLSVPAIQAFLVIVAAISVAGTFTAIWIGILGRIAALETKVDSVSSRILGDRYPGWHRRDMFEWCLQTEAVNASSEWRCFDPFLLPSGREESPIALLRPDVNRHGKTDRR